MPAKDLPFDPSAYTELANEKVGGKILFATDDFFAPAEMMIDDKDPVWIADKYIEFGKSSVFFISGKWMDGWETRRRREAGHDWCILKLGLPGVIYGVEFDTAFFTGNQVPAASIQGAYLDSDLPLTRKSQFGVKASKEEMAAAQKIQSEAWETILVQSELKPGVPETRHNYFKIDSKKPWTHLRINQFPDGGIARLRVYGQVSFDWSKIQPSQLLDFASVSCGARALSWSDAHYGSPKKLLYPGRSEGMFDGWETARNPKRPPVFEFGADGHLIIPGNHWSIIKLGHQMTVDHVEVDTNHYKGNYPESMLLEGICIGENDENPSPDAPWFKVVERTKLMPHQRHLFVQKATSLVDPNLIVNQNALKCEKPITHVKLTIFPDGGVSRLRVFGRISK